MGLFLVYVDARNKNINNLNRCWISENDLKGPVQKRAVLESIF